MPNSPKAKVPPGHRSGAKRKGLLKQSELKAPRFNISLNSQSASTFAVRARRKASRREAEAQLGHPFPVVVKERSAPIRPGYVSAKAQPSAARAIPEHASSRKSTW